MVILSHSVNYFGVRYEFYLQKVAKIIGCGLCQRCFAQFFHLVSFTHHLVVVVVQQVALAWGIKRGTPVLPKAVSEGHIKENIKALDLKLDEGDMKAIENIGIHHRYLMQTWMYKPDEVPDNYWDGEE